MLVADTCNPQAHSSTLKGMPGIAINEDSLREAASETPSRNLFKEVLESKWALVIVSPEMLTTPGFNQVLTDSLFQQHLCLVFIDECHLVDEQGADFRPCYKSIGLLRSRIPTHIPWIAVSATLPPGPCFNTVMDSLGFQGTHYIHQSLPINNPHICYIPKILQYPISGTSFLDLSWLIPTSATSPHDITKTLIFCETIELGHRVCNFLQHLLPQSLHADKDIILPYHSLLSKPGRTRVMENFRSGTTRVVVGTDCFTWGVDVPDIRNVVVFGLPSSFSKLVQQIGRAGRDGKQAYAIMYAAQWVKDTPEKLQKSTKDANLKRREAMCPVLRSWFNTSPGSCPRTILCGHFVEVASQPDNCCLHHHKAIPTMEPTEARIKQFSTPHAKAAKLQSGDAYKPFTDQTYTESASQMIATWARQTWEEIRGQNTLLPSTTFFPLTFQKRLSGKINMVTSVKQLSVILKDWPYIDSYKDRLFKACREMVKGLDAIRQESQTVMSEPIKITIPTLKQKICDEDLTDVQPQKRQCGR
jgi:superfamily II DNA helicase RecQ